MNDRYEKTVKIPIRIVDGQVKYFYGGNLPEIKNGVIGDLVLPEYGIQDNRFLEVSQKEEVVEILPSGVIVCVAINSKDAPKDKLDFILKKETKEITIEKFVEVRLLEPLRMQIRGSKKSNLFAAKCFIPSLKEDEVVSLNDAYTKISQVFEPLRISHTGNVFEKCYYEDNGIWYQLDTLRENEESKFEEKMFLDYKLYTLTERIRETTEKLDINESKLLGALFYNKILSGCEIKKIFNNEKKVYIKVINSLFDKGLITDIKE